LYLRIIQQGRIKGEKSLGCHGVSSFSSVAYSILRSYHQEEGTGGCNGVSSFSSVACSVLRSSHQEEATGGKGTVNESSMPTGGGKLVSSTILPSYAALKG